MREAVADTTQWAFALAGLGCGYWIAWRLLVGIERRFYPSGRRIPAWVFWVAGTLFLAVTFSGPVIGLVAQDVLFNHGRVVTYALRHLG
jgi:hypothetical protein